MKFVDGELGCSSLVAGNYAVDILGQKGFTLTTIRTLGVFLADYPQANLRTRLGELPHHILSKVNYLALSKLVLVVLVLAKKGSRCNLPICSLLDEVLSLADLLVVHQARPELSFVLFDLSLLFVLIIEGSFLRPLLLKLLLILQDERLVCRLTLSFNHDVEELWLLALTQYGVTVLKSFYLNII